MDCIANFALEVSKNKIEEMNLESWKEFKNTLSQLNVSLDHYAIAVEYEDLVYNNNEEELKENEVKKIDDSFFKFQEEFKQKTGLSISIGYHDSEEIGSAYDEVQGTYLSLDFDEVYQLTPLGEKNKDLFNWKYFVLFS